MAWLMLVAALACFAMALLLPVGTPVVLLLLLGALALLLLATTRWLEDHQARATRPASQMVDADELRRISETLEASTSDEPHARA